MVIAFHRGADLDLTFRAAENPEFSTTSVGMG
jgi:hypothetical protein